MAFSHSDGLGGAFEALFVVDSVGTTAWIVLVDKVVIVIVNAICAIANNCVIPGEQTIGIVCNVEQSNSQYEDDTDGNCPSGR